MADLRLFGNTSNIIRFILKSSLTGQGLTGLASGSSGLIISTICDNEATAAAYTVAGSTIETITTLGTFAAPTATKARFKEVDAANHKGLYEFQFADARFAVASSRRMVVSVTGAANLLDTDYEIQLVRFDPYTALASQASVDTIDDFLDTEIAAIKAKTDNLPASPANEATLTTIAGYLDTEVAAIKAKTDNLPALPAAAGDIPTAIQNADALLDRANAIETGLTLRGALRLIAAACAGIASGLATATAIYRNAVADSKPRITATVDAHGNRTAITTDVT